jgi:hypothetical protein
VNIKQIGIQTKNTNLTESHVCTSEKRGTEYKIPHFQVILLAHNWSTYTKTLLKILLACIPVLIVIPILLSLYFQLLIIGPLRVSISQTPLFFPGRFFWNNISREWNSNVDVFKIQQNTYSKRTTPIYVKLKWNFLRKSIKANTYENDFFFISLVNF